MRISVNLATKPFVEIRPLLARLRIAMAALALTMIALGIWLHALNRRAAQAEAQMNLVKAKTAELQRERQSNETRMHQPANQEVLARSRFLNDLFARKSFSWTAVMMDLERVLPTGVQVTSIEPQVSTTDGTVTIRLRVSGDRDRAVQLVRNLEGSARFVHPRLSNESAQAAEGNGRVVQASSPGAPGLVEFDILSGYNPLPELRKADPARSSPASAVGGGRGTGSSTPASRSPRKSALPKSGLPKSGLPESALPESGSGGVR